MKDNKEHNPYIGNLISGISSLLMGMKTTTTIFCRRKTTRQYLGNWRTLELSEHFRDTPAIPRDEQSEHHCVACGLCQMACPSDTIKVMSETIETEDGEKKRILARYEYDLSSCIFCQLCVNTCPHDTITFGRSFERVVSNRSKLVLALNHPGSHVGERKKSAAPQAGVAK